jgi:RNA polymerase sigma-70 factor, ECF subfamily
MSADPRTLLDLLRRALSGDSTAWNDFFERLRKYVHAEVRKILGPQAQGPLDNSVVVQSALRRVWAHIESQFPDEPDHAALRRFLGWVKRISHNRSFQELRQQRKRAVLGGAAVGEFADPRSADQTRQRVRIAAELATALATLPERKRQVVELFWFENLSDAEIGERLGCSGGAAKVERFRALRALRTPRLQTLLEECHDRRC